MNISITLCKRLKHPGMTFLLSLGLKPILLAFQTFVEQTKLNLLCLSRQETIQISTLLKIMLLTQGACSGEKIMPYNPIGCTFQLDIMEELLLQFYQVLPFVDLRDKLLQIKRLLTGQIVNVQTLNLKWGQLQEKEINQDTLLK